jgi:4-hydroxy-2-oxoheptanedioate aldolase
MIENRFKRALSEGRPLVGIWLQFGHATVTEVVGGAGFDWALLDTEHAPVELPQVVDQLRVLEPTGTPAIVRPAWNDQVLIKRLLDIGVQTLLVPYIESVEAARQAVAAVRYPPRGVRGVAAVHRANRYGRALTAYAAGADAEMCVLVQLETRQAVTRLEEIAAVDGVDGLFIGPSDLAASLGHIGDNAHPEVRSCIEDACRRARTVQKPIGILAPVEADARAFFEMGFSHVAVGSDIGLLRQGADALRARFRPDR